ncbi:cation/proton antiporter [Legionella nautarum]|uniref:Cation/proton antiporter n=1 Tax=Legionella nautarum TaxID=45070 RepID=A0A0W0WMY6_9GAMM|nr:Na+/H+ antiporter [Legionella nautarum]KTD33698.1 cation/proton antiporter [Legionella nautarum]
MDFFEPTIFLLFLAVLSLPIANRFHLPLEIFLVAVSAIISFIPWLPHFQINPEIVFKLFLPPILFSAAYFVSWQDFKFNLRPITLHAFGLVIFTTAAVAPIVRYIFPELSWAECFLLGAIVSPTDASATVAIIKKLNSQRRLLSIIEGESLINDATALLLFRFSLAAIVTGTFSITDVAMNFFTILIGGIITGLVIGFIAIRLIQYINNALAETTFTFITAFASYLIADRFGFSGVISTVVCGVFVGRVLPKYASSQMMYQTRASWSIFLFIINCFVFILIGVELPWVSQALSYSLLSVVLYSVIVVLIIIAIRIVWVYSSAYLSRKLIPSIEKKDPMPSWQLIFVVGWSGMRGVLSLAAALAIPIQLAPGIPFPHRHLLIFIIYVVVVATLIIPALTLPTFIKRFQLIEDPQIRMREEAQARVSTLKSALDAIVELTQNEPISEEVLLEFKKPILRRLSVIKTQLDESPCSTINKDYQTLKKLTLAAITSERQTLLNMRKTGQIRDEVFHLLNEELNLEEIRARSLRI